MPPFKLSNAAVEGEEDDNGHLWPYYTYKTGTVSADVDGIQKVVKTVAIPIPVDETW